jgi:CubicO group peptidase (beta-lactamase class C family)
MALKDSADGILKAAVSRGDVPGVVAGATTAEGTVYEGGFGERAAGGGTAMTPDTVGWIASMTKAVTGAAAMQLVEQSRLELDGPASAVIPYLGEVGVLEGFDDDGQPKMRPPKRPVTLRHLLTHTSGYVYEIWNTDILAYQEAKGVPQITSCENAALTTPLLFDPGERWDYGIGIDWAGKMVEAVSGQRLGQYMKENIFDPLGMGDTAFRITPAMQERMATVHVRGEDGAWMGMEFTVEQDPEFEMGGGGLYSTVGDYLKFIRMILNKGAANGHRVLRPETVEAMSVNSIGDNRVVNLATAMPPYSNDAEFFPGMEKTWGLTFMINNEEAPTGRTAGSLAWAGLANSYFWIDPAKGIGGAYLTQVLPFADEKSLPLYLDFETAVYRSL